MIETKWQPELRQTGTNMKPKQTKTELERNTPANTTSEVHARERESYFD